MSRQTHAVAVSRRQTPTFLFAVTAIVATAALPVHALFADRLPADLEVHGSPNVLLPVIDATDSAALAEHVDRMVVVEGTVVTAEWSRSGAVLLIRFQEAGENGFMGTVFQNQRESLDGAYGGDLATAVSGQPVRIRGRLQAYGGQDPRYATWMQIIVSTDSQISIVTPT